MNETLEDEIAASLRARGDGMVDVAGLRTAAVARARQIQRRRSALAGASLAAVVGVSWLAVSVAPRGGGPGWSTAPRLVGPSTAAPVVGLTAHLPAADAPPAAQRPDMVGTDPAVVHFDVDGDALGATGLSWDVRPGTESVAVWTGDVNHFTTWIALGRDLDAVRRGAAVGGSPDRTVPISVAGRPGTAERYPNGFWVLTWQPVDGLWTSVVQEASSGDDLVQTASAVRLDKAQRCVVPLRVRSAPAHATWTGCDAAFGPYKPWEVGGISFTHVTGETMRLGIGWYSVDEPFVPNRIVGGRPARLRGDAQNRTVVLSVPIHDWVNLVVTVRPRVDGELSTTPENGFTEADMVQLAESAMLSTDVTDPATWPTRPLA